MKHVWMTLAMMVPMGAWAMCVSAPARPACVPAGGQFDGERAMNACAAQMEGFAEQMKMYMACERDPARQQAMRDEIVRIKDDFDRAARPFAGAARKPGSTVNNPQVLPVMIDVNIH